MTWLPCSMYSSTIVCSRLRPSCCSLACAKELYSHVTCRPALWQDERTHFVKYLVGDGGEGSKSAEADEHFDSGMIGFHAMFSRPSCSVNT
jgi:hypothetical protein